MTDIVVGILFGAWLFVALCIIVSCISKFPDTFDPEWVPMDELDPTPVDPFVQYPHTDKVMA